ncbi:MAG TPA: exodeoxyribonuclease III [bacterium]|nr:exodeoxyribonuclease III [bacterium]
MRIATWNVNGVRARLDFVRAWLRDRQPDVVGIQELKADEDQFPYEELEAEGWRAAIHGQKAWNGVAVLTRADAPAPEVTQRGLPGQEEMGARLITADVEGLSFTTVYVPNGKSVSHDDFPRKLAWLDDLRVHLESEVAADKPAVLCGDFNVCPAPIDSWNEERLHGHIFHTDEERSRFAAFTDAGLRDVLRSLNPDLQVFSWWDYRGGAFHRKMGLRIDLILATDPVLKRVRGIGVDRDWRKKQDGLTPSDHAPVVMELE